MGTLTDIEIDEKIKTTIQPPKLWKVIFFNDDQTPMDFVVELLVNIFKHNENKARDLTLEIHNTGSAIAGIYPHEIAEHRGLIATQVSRTNGFPLQIQVVEE
jgi:ATP-dependent Clp protease adaptor protein ClpS